MKNMRRVLSALTVLTLGSTAAISVVACGEDTTPYVYMSNQLLRDLGIYNEVFESNISIKLGRTDNNSNIPTWVILGTSTFSASGFLDANGIAKSEAGMVFLKDMLKLKSDENGKFDRKEAAKIKFNVDRNISPNLELGSNGDGLKWNSGTIDGQWINANNEEMFTVTNIKIKKGSVNTGTLDLDWALTEKAFDDFNNSEETLLSNFKIDAKIEDVKDKLENKDITGLLKTDSDNGIWIRNIVPFFNRGELKIETTYIMYNGKNETFVAGDKLRFSVFFGDARFGCYDFILKEKETAI